MPGISMLVFFVLVVSKTGTRLNIVYSRQSLVFFNVLIVFEQLICTSYSGTLFNALSVYA